MLEREQITIFDLDAARHLYNLALFVTGDKLLGTQAADSAIRDVCTGLAPSADVRMFQHQYIRCLFKYCKRSLRKSARQDDDLVINEAHPYGGDGNKLAALLQGLRFDERYILLLFCLQKYSVSEIAVILRKPIFVVERRLGAAVSFVARQQDR